MTARVIVAAAAAIVEALTLAGIAEVIEVVVAVVRTETSV